ncbi:LOW QUALITY PROTEIN: mitochondrial import inner membrane translocase subunit TIM17-2-like [Asparagus officinalis]|uniref:LOW QUALITY PROTEIN: mitochondrial import inner membrane translocase subunit TIM17-2-like n=1 Tax=Asparagus officinalis TaxID=4686 RepID=UPI00098E1B0A|nr:LOW QUALITY PROTEIN: mitochondrial import inner membrane translocase subunit TIM17-2-like [Asparagus officinalis]
MGTPETSREPCPDRILDDVGGAFGMGAVGGFASGGGLFSGFDCSMVYLRQKEILWNFHRCRSATGRTGGFLQMRQGARSAARSAAFGGVLLALIEGAGIMLNRVLSNPQNFPPMEDPGMVMPPNVPQAEVGGSGIPLSYQNRTQTNPTDKESTGSSSWLGGLFGKKEDVKSSSDGGEKTLESFDAPSVPTFEFK